MKKLISVLLLSFIGLVGTFAFQRFTVKLEQSEETIFSKNTSSATTSCAAPKALTVDKIGSVSFAASWIDPLSTEWDYFVQEEGIGLPNTTNSTKTKSSSITITTDFSGSLLLPDTTYELFVRSKCSDGTYSDWSIPLLVRTNCLSQSVFPYTESFASTSTTKYCWRIIDKNNQLNTSNYPWNITNTAIFNGASSPNNDWLISPPFTLDATKIYALSYDFVSGTRKNSEYEIRLSKNGIATSEFKDIVAHQKAYSNPLFEKRTHYISQINGEIHLGWHVSTQGSTEFVIKNVKLEEVDCIGINPEEVQIQSLTHNSITINWKDTNSAWEVYVQPKTGIIPVAGGSRVTTSTFTSSSINGGGTLQPDTEYEFYIRSNCGPGKFSKWEGPFVFKTACTPFSIPFSEGFNSNSITKDCWTIVKANATYVDNTMWKIKKNNTAYEGDSFIEYNNPFSKIHDDWLISPIITGLNSTKVYRLSYRYRVNLYDDNRFEVLASTTGKAISSFTKTLIPTKKYRQPNHWIEETIMLSNINGSITFAWHALDGDGANIALDNIQFEEVVGCIQPHDLTVEAIEANKATLVWKDDFNTQSSWEYIVQKSGLPAPSGAGKPTSTNKVTVTTDVSNNPLESNTSYEYYVRSSCQNSTFSEWSGPFVFSTLCPVFSFSFRENFEEGSMNLNCWSVIDYNEGVYPLYIHLSGGKPNIWFVSWGGASGQGAQLIGYDDWTKSAWLVSPTISFVAGKTYRLKYKIKSDANNPTTKKLEILASNQGIDKSKFTTTIMPLKAYSNYTSFEEEIHFISNLTGNVNIAFHSPSYEGVSLKSLYLDDVYIEEVENCPEPIQLSVKDIKTNQVELGWKDDQGGSQWEYWIQLEDEGAPTGGNGILTNSKNPVATKDYKGDSLEHNTTYEYYVRTKCNDGSFSIWAGPFVFTTACGIYDIPFWEGFNKNTTSIRCWQTINAKTGLSTWKSNTADKFEGDQSYISNNINGFIGEIDDWLISPTLRLDGGTYLLKFNYKAIDKQYMGTWLMHEFDNNLEISLSTQGTSSLTNFTTILLPSAKMVTAGWQEKAILIQGVKADVNIAWRILSKGKTYFNIDNITLDKVESCLEPIHLEVTPTSPTSFDLSWTQLDATNQWEVIVVPYKQPVTYTPIQSFTVSGNPKTTLTGLTAGMSYSVYIRAICNTNASSAWSNSIDFQTQVNQNNNCNGAIKIPVNKSTDCSTYAAVSFTGATASTTDTSVCHLAGNYQNDIWFTFKAESPTHILTFLDLFSANNYNQDFNFNLGLTIYNTTCGAIIATTPALCLNVNATTPDFLLENLTVGQDYLLRIQSPNDTPDYRFNICLSTPTFITTSPSGDLYSTEELINDVFINSTCKLASNISYQNADGSTEAQAYNTFGYFNSNNSIFPFKEGIVLSTNEVKYVPGPYRGYSSSRGDNDIRWTGDKDINDAIDAAGGGPKKDKRVTQVEFDFVSVKDSIAFEYLFASNSYHSNCGDACNVGALFAAWLIDTTTGEGQNLAKIQGTTIPISLNTIRDSKKSGAACSSVNPKWYWKHYANEQDNPFEAPIDFVGLTKPMKSETIKIIPGRKYHIKLAVMDFCTSVEHSSAVFFNAASFDLGSIQLGPDWSIDNETALCTGESRLLKSGLGVSDELKAEIQWYKDGKLIPGETKPDLVVTETGRYTIKANYTEIDCQSEGEIQIEMYPDIKNTIPAPSPIYVCRYALSPLFISLENSVQEMLASSDGNYIAQGIYETADDATLGEHPIDTIEKYNLGQRPENRSFYIRIEHAQTGCYAIYDLKVIIQEGEQPTKPEDVKSCQSYTLPKLASNQTYFTEPDGKGVKHQAGDVLEPGIHTLYILQQNEGACFEQTSFTISITPEPELQHISDQVLECEFYVLPELPADNKYFIEKDGQRMEIMPNTTIYNDTKIFIVAESEDHICTKETYFTVKYNDCPIPKGFSPNGDGINDRFDLSLHNVSSLKIFNRLGTEVYAFKGKYLNQWDGKDKNGKALPSGTYYYIVVSFNKTRSGWVEINK